MNSNSNDPYYLWSYVPESELGDSSGENHDEEPRSGECDGKDDIKVSGGDGVSVVAGSSQQSDSKVNDGACNGVSVVVGSSQPNDNKVSYEDDVVGSGSGKKTVTRSDDCSEESEVEYGFNEYGEWVKVREYVETDPEWGNEDDGVVSDNFDSTDSCFTYDENFEEVIRPSDAQRYKIKQHKKATIQKWREMGESKK